MGTLPGMGRSGILGRLRGDGSLIRALFVALILQILIPLTGVLPNAQAAAPDGAIVVCTAHGIVTLVPDGDGGWTQHDEPEARGLACSFCLPLMSGMTGPVSEQATPLPVVVRHARQDLTRIVAALPALPPGSFSPRAPPSFR